jgi:hypothetical protein
MHRAQDEEVTGIIRLSGVQGSGQSSSKLFKLLYDCSKLFKGPILFKIVRVNLIFETNLRRITPPMIHPP